MHDAQPIKRIRTAHCDRGRGVTVALPPFKRNGKGSTPFDLTDCDARHGA